MFIVFLLGLTSWTSLEGFALLVGEIVPGVAFDGSLNAPTAFTGMTEEQFRFASLIQGTKRTD